jgi:hypothetical protein
MTGNKARPLPSTSGEDRDPEAEGSVCPRGWGRVCSRVSQRETGRTENRFRVPDAWFTQVPPAMLACCHCLESRLDRFGCLGVYGWICGIVQCSHGQAVAC